MVAALAWMVASSVSFGQTSESGKNNAGLRQTYGMHRYAQTGVGVSSSGHE